NPLRLQDRNVSAQPTPFTDNLSVLIDAWKRLDAVEYSRNGSPPPVATVCGWVRQPWRDTPQVIVLIWNHDVYGWKF
ncbi:hypothetical protein F441_07391, partial [Phytophthora nicotianae CJ01A1]